MSRSFDCDVAVLGAGIIGASAALRLARRGLDTAIVSHPSHPSCSNGNAAHIATEQTRPLAEPSVWMNWPERFFGSSAPASIRLKDIPSVAPWVLKFLRATTDKRAAKGQLALNVLMRDALSSLQGLADETGQGDLIKSSGHLVVLEDENKRPAFQRMLDHARCESLTSIESTSLETKRFIEQMLGRRIDQAVQYQGTGSVVSPGRFLDGIFDAALASGARHLECSIERVRPLPSGFHLAGRTAVLTCRRLVLAAGVDSRPVARQLGLNLPMIAECGYHLEYEIDPCHLQLLRVPIVSFDRNIIASPVDNRLRVCGFVEFAGLNSPSTKSRAVRLNKRAREFAPALTAMEPCQSWMGRRPTLPDYLPAIGWSARQPGLFVATGHQHLGLTLAGTTAELIEDAFCDKGDVRMPNAVHPDRFS